MTAKSKPRSGHKTAATKIIRKPAPAANRLDVAEVRKNLGLSRAVFARLSQFSERAIAKWEAGEPLSAPAKQRIKELKRLYEALNSIMVQDFIGEWLQTPIPDFDGLKPLEVIERGEMDRIWRLIYLMESGNPS